MLKPNKLKKGDKVAVISLSNGILGEQYCEHQLKIGAKRLENMGLEPIFMSNSLKGKEFLENNPEKKYEDLVDAFENKEIKAIICAIGGFDSYKILPFLFNNDKFKKIVSENPKIFIGFSDTTINHLAFYKLGLKTYYGHSFLVDFAELENDMLKFTKKSFLNFFKKSRAFFLESSPFWYEERKGFGKDQIGVKRIVHKENKGFEFYGQNKIVNGILLGGCLDTIYEGMIGKNFPDQKEICEKYNIFLDEESWKNKILFLETSEEKPLPDEFEKMLIELDMRSILKNVNAIIFGKPQDECFYEEYKDLLLYYCKKYDTPIVFNLNFGHSFPKTIIPYGFQAEIDFKNRIIKIKEGLVN
ncbi:S66 family peptidase [Williamsoniiplasma luminosum]|uniref:Carboxypeptidase n=1 Tax=Williamsoniiplasma luminosum TaxID=214888 RepID=A0A2S0NJU7_9MOLU|nr:S66 peptidase family protein [Williamsoniiplasma luminosum]AVP49293.1 MAG: carboxypeptidase [Williamsoniiplasma luminosum]